MVEAAKLVDPLLIKPEVSLKSTTFHTVHWRNVQYGDPMKDDFRVFLTAMWRHLGLSDPTELQLSVAYYMQHHPWSDVIDRLVIMAFRGAAKSWITAAYCLWNLHRNQQLKVGVLSGSGRRSTMFVQFCLTVISSWDVLHYLKPGPQQKQSGSAFDVGPALPDQTPSVWSAGITSQVVGFRADIIVGDDIETNTNSLTEDMREKLAHNVKEFDSIIKPGGQIIFLGTPQTESSIYNKLPTRGYIIKIWPVRFPNLTQRKNYGDRLAPWVKWRLDNDPDLVGKSVEPTRFSDEDLRGREISQGQADFALQFMLDTSLSDVDKYPLRLRDLIVMSLDWVTGPDSVSWGNGDHLVLRSVNAIAQDGDRPHGPSSVSETFSKYQAIYAFIDPSGRGADETTLTIAGVLHGSVFLLKQAGFKDGFGAPTLEGIAKLLVAYKVQKCRVEDDFGSGMFAKLLEPVVKKEWEKVNAKRSKIEAFTTAIETETARKVQKELRILETLEPVMNSHRLVVATEVLIEDYEQTRRRDGSTNANRYSLMYQMTRLTREVGCIPHDDRIEGLSGVVAMFLDMMGLHPADQAAAASLERLEQELDELFDEEDWISKGTRAVVQGLRGALKGIAPPKKR